MFRVIVYNNCRSQISQHVSITCLKYSINKRLRSYSDIHSAKGQVNKLKESHIQCKNDGETENITGKNNIKDDTHEHNHSHSHSHFHFHTHAHSHSHPESTELLLGSEKDPKVRITRVGLYSNILMAVVKASAGYYYNSQALIADAIHAVVDMAADVTTLITVGISKRKPSNLYPRGYGKLESIASLGVSGLLVSASIGMFIPVYNLGVDSLFEYMQWSSSTSLGINHIHHHIHPIVDINAAWVAAGAILVKEWVFRITMKVAKETRSSVLVANAWHHRADALTSGVALGAIILANIVHNPVYAAWFDPIAGLLVAYVVLRAGLNSSKQALYELLDNVKSVDNSVKETISTAAEAALFPGWKIVSLTSLQSGSQINVDIDISYTLPTKTENLSPPSFGTILAATTTLQKAVESSLSTPIKARVRII